MQDSRQQSIPTGGIRLGWMSSRHVKHAAQDKERRAVGNWKPLMLITAARMRFAHALLTIFACLTVSGAAVASEFASQVTRIVVPFAAGGGTDIIARHLAQEVGKQIN